MPRRHRRVADAGDERAAPRPGSAFGQRREQWRGIDYEVRNVLGSAQRPYRCPGCDQEIGSVSHVVSWPSYDTEAADRRHWHTACWRAREDRAPRILRGRGAPRY